MAPETKAIDPRLLNETAVQRAWHEARAWSTGTILGSIFWLLACSGMGALAFHEQHWLDAMGAYVIGPVAGAFLGLLGLLFIALLLALRGQRDALRSALKAAPAALEEGGQRSYEVHHHHHYEEGSNPQIFYPSSPDY